MSLDTIMNLIFSLIMINLIMLGAVMIICILTLKKYQHYIDEKEIEETMNKILKDKAEEKIEIL